MEYGICYTPTMNEAHLTPFQMGQKDPFSLPLTKVKTNSFNFYFPGNQNIVTYATFSAFVAIDEKGIFICYRRCKVAFSEDMQAMQNILDNDDEVHI